MNRDLIFEVESDVVSDLILNEDVTPEETPNLPSIEDLRTAFNRCAAMLSGKAKDLQRIKKTSLSPRERHFYEQQISNSHVFRQEMARRARSLKIGKRNIGRVEDNYASYLFDLITYWNKGDFKMVECSGEPPGPIDVNSSQVFLTINIGFEKSSRFLNHAFMYSSFARFLPLRTRRSFAPRTSALET